MTRLVNAGLCRALHSPLRGAVNVYTASAEIGQGSDTAFAMIAAEAMGVPLDMIQLESGDTDFGVDLGAYSSRQTLMTGHAVKAAAEDAKAKVLAVLSEELGVPADSMDVKNGTVEFAEGPIDFMALRDRYIKEHRGWIDNPDDERLTFRKHPESPTLPGEPSSEPENTNRPCSAVNSRVQRLARHRLMDARPR